MNHPITFIHFWKVEISDSDLQQLLDHWPFGVKTWCILLEEKLRRVENEISIK